MTIAKARPAESATNPFSTPSPRLWRQGFSGFGSGFPSINIVDDPADKIGHHLYEDFLRLPTPLTTLGYVGAWNTYVSTTAIFATAGIGNLNAAKFSGTTDDDLVAMAVTFSGVEITVNSGRSVYFESRVKFDSVADNAASMFFGLFTPIVPGALTHFIDVITGPTGAFVTTTNVIGFARLETDGDDMLFIYQANGQTAQAKFALPTTTLLAATWYKFGFVFDGVQTIRVYVNGVEVTACQLVNADLVAATFPSSVPLAPAILHKEGSGATNIDYMNWFRFGYLNNAADGFSLLAPQ